MTKHILLIALFIAFGNTTIIAQEATTKPRLQSFTGFFDFKYDDAKGELYLEVPKTKLAEQFLYVHSLRTGLGSNDIGLDRGQLGDQAVVTFIKSGNKLLLLQPNLKFRAETENAQERKSISEAFARSVLFGFEIKDTQGDSYIIDFTPFLMEDAHGIAQSLKRQKEGTYKYDKTRSALWMGRTKSFPQNTEFESLLTFKGEPAGINIRSVAPDASSISVIQHISFVQLPDDKYEPRAFDPRCGSYSMDYLDYSTPIWEPIKKRFVTRHRLEKIDAAAAISKAKDPIIYYLDSGTPEPVRSALLEGARWWNQAYEAIGYKNAFQVKMLPEDADPMDVRYNVIQWVHRSTRGWSYGGSVIDPRTGEIIKGHVSLGSLRIRQDFMIAQAMLDKPFESSDDNYQPMLEMALARIRQLAAHEVGHTIGFAHNFAASANGDASVMDYPHPQLQEGNGVIDVSQAYDTGIGEWDKVTVAYSYGNVPATTTEKAYLNTILQEAQAKGLRYMSDPDARPEGGAHATAHLWDTGKNAATRLGMALEMRRIAMRNFSADNIRTGEPYSTLEDVFVPLYFFHRFQTEAAVKMIGGMDYNYAVKGDEQLITRNLNKEEQVQALDVVLQTLDPDNLAIPEDKLSLFPPRAYGYYRSRESFKSNMGVAFDAIGAAATAGEMTLSLLFNPQRANRLVQQKARDINALSLEDVMNRLQDNSFKNRTGSEYEKEIIRSVQFLYLQQLMNLSVSDQSIPQTKAIAMEGIANISAKLRKGSGAFEVFLLSEIDRFNRAPENFKQLAVPKIPDGSPIGSYQCDF
ncbi:zinc-dependent metalloprotease [Patiriisocius sp. Uisw_047]|uniref:zinc-dependent metalloprotease n=1 Tax=Patiriisocius sp. Uisw_047 TaxID=3230969 RepID=UPI0039E80748